ncbi:hypothetical protein EAI_04120 [Harpegnathos saltator]|uniref:Uncharacterized protein n=1 Tax=Harpegnathos saltator TaxID=610380 RepID=E2BEU7_HARSA|nr:hypothetical protein EAI_04120 [Harpegnathos saltator]
MANSISDAVIDILNNSYVMVDEDLILNNDGDRENLYEECTDNPTTDADYNPLDYAEPPTDYIPLEYKAKIVALAEAHPHWNLKTLQRQGGSHLKRKDYLIQWKKDVKSGGTRVDKWQTIDNETFEHFREARSCYEQPNNDLYKSANRLEPHQRYKIINITVDIVTIEFSRIQLSNSILSSSARLSSNLYNASLRRVITLAVSLLIHDFIVRDLQAAVPGQSKIKRIGIGDSNKLLPREPIGPLLWLIPVGSSRTRSRAQDLSDPGVQRVNDSDSTRNNINKFN